jgi:hypothetical protein
MPAMFMSSLGGNRWQNLSWGCRSGSWTAVFGALIDTGSRWSVFGGYLFGSVLMLAAALVGALFAVAAERRSLESISRPLAAAD